MIEIPVIKTADADGNECLSPIQPFPADAISIRCDGNKYVVFQQGDTVPEQQIINQ